MEGDFENFQSSLVCGLCAVCWDFDFFKVLWCVGSVVCRNFENFQSFLVCGLCGVGTLKVFKIPLCVDSVVCGDF